MLSRLWPASARIVLFALFPTIYLWPGFHASNRSIFAPYLDDSFGFIQLRSAAENLASGSFATAFLNHPIGEPFWSLEQVSQGTMAVFIVATRAVLSPYQALHVWILIGWTLTSLAVFRLSKTLGIGTLLSTLAGLLTPMLPIIKVVSTQFLAYAHSYPLVMVMTGGVLIGKSNPRRNSGYRTRWSFSHGWLLALGGLLLAVVTDYYLLVFSVLVLFASIILAYPRHVALSIRLCVVAAATLLSSLLLPYVSRIIFRPQQAPEMGFGPPPFQWMFRQLSDGVSWHSYFAADGYGIATLFSGGLSRAFWGNRSIPLQAFMSRSPYLGAIAIVAITTCAIATVKCWRQGGPSRRANEGITTIGVVALVLAVVADQSFRSVLGALQIHPGLGLVNTVPRIRFPFRASIGVSIIALVVATRGVQEIVRWSRRRVRSRVWIGGVCAVGAVLVLDLRPLDGSQMMHPQTKELAEIAEFLKQSGAQAIVDNTGRVPSLPRINGVRVTNSINDFVVNAAWSPSSAAALLNLKGVTHIVSFGDSISSNWGAPDYAPRFSVALVEPLFERVAEFRITSNNRDEFWPVNVFRVNNAVIDSRGVGCRDCPRYIVDTDGSIESSLPAVGALVRDSSVQIKMRTVPNNALALHYGRIELQSTLETDVRLRLSTPEQSRNIVLRTGTSVEPIIQLRSGQSVTITVISRVDVAGGAFAIKNVAFRPIGSDR